MSEPNEDDLLRLAQSVTDGRPVSWDSNAVVGNVSTGAIRHLQVLETIAQVCRMPPDASADAAGTAQNGPLASSVASPDTPSEARRAWGPLEIVARLGCTTGSAVYRCHDPSLQRDVALKLPAADDLETQERFLDEARRLARVRHPNVLVVHGAARHDGRVGLWTDLLHGSTLEECLQKQGRFGPREAALAGIDVCRALAAVHAAGLVHRDVKTSNVMREDGGRIVLMDFGTVSDRPRAGASPRGPAAEATITGSPLYMAPELFGGAPATPAADLYAIGVLLFRLTTGRYPVEATTVAALTDKLARGDIERLRDARPDLPMTFVRAVDRALSADPAQRFATAGAMEAALAASLEVAAPRVRRLVALAAAAAAVILAAVFAPRLLQPRTLELEAALYRQGAEADERLVSGGRVRPGDRLFLEMQLSRAAYVYIVNEDASGNAYLLFPLAGLDLGNPLPAKARHRLPGRDAGTSRTWQVDTSGGKETILVVASREPLTKLEAALATFQQPERSAMPDEPLRTRLRGMGRMPASPDRDAPGEARRVDDLVQSLGLETPSSKDVVVRRIELENP